MNLSPLIEIDELLRIYSNPNVLLFDASNGPDAKSNFDKLHLEGANYLDTNVHLAEIPEHPSNGGRHPLPQIQNFAKTIAALGISPDKHVIIYDSNFGSNAAARFWWMLRAIGHEKVQVLNGGLKEALARNFPSTSQVIPNTPTSVVYETKRWLLPTVTIHEVEEATNSRMQLVIDVRDAKRYAGLIEPIDVVAGHIPGAINVPFMENLDENGLFLPPEKLKEKYEKILRNIASKHCILHCGSGVTACHTLLAFAHAGMEIPSLYVGSWSEWSSNGKEISKS